MQTLSFPQPQLTAREHNDFLKTRAGLTHLLHYPATMPVIMAVSLSRENYIRDGELSNTF